MTEQKDPGEDSRVEQIVFFAEKLLVALKSTLVFLWLGFLYLLLLFFVIGTLSSYQFHQRVSVFVKDGQTVSSVISDARELETAKGLLQKLSGKNEDAKVEFNRQERASINSDVLMQYEAADAARYEVINRLDSMLAAAGTTDEEIADLFYAAEYAQFLDLHEHEVSAVDAARFRQEIDLLKEREALLDTITTSENNWTGDEDKLREIRKELSALERDRKAKQAVVDNSNPQILVINDELRVLDSVCLRNFCFGMFAKQTSSILVLFLTLAMGMLGSTIFITQEFIAHGSKDRPMTWFLIRPLLGMVTAVAIFVLAKAGQITLAESADNLNPWVISFLAVISGLLSEHAIERIGRAAKPIFSPEESQIPRWGVGLEARLAEPSVDSGQLSKALGVPNTRLQEWARQESAVPFREQELIASWLRLPMNELFTDLPPAKESAN